MFYRWEFIPSSFALDVIAGQFSNNQFLREIKVNTSYTARHNIICLTRARNFLK